MEYQKIINYVISDNFDTDVIPQNRKSQTRCLVTMLTEILEKICHAQHFSH